MGVLLAAWSGGARKHKVVPENIAIDATIAECMPGDLEIGG